MPSWYKTPGDGSLLINARGEACAENPLLKQQAISIEELVASGFMNGLEKEILVTLFYKVSRQSSFNFSSHLANLAV